MGVRLVQQASPSQAFWAGRVAKVFDANVQVVVGSADDDLAEFLTYNFWHRDSAPTSRLSGPL